MRVGPQEGARHGARQCAAHSEKPSGCRCRRVPAPMGRWERAASRADMHTTRCPTRQSGELSAGLPRAGAGVCNRRPPAGAAVPHAHAGPAAGRPIASDLVSLSLLLPRVSAPLRGSCVWRRKGRRAQLRWGAGWRKPGIGAGGSIRSNERRRVPAPWIMCGGGAQAGSDVGPSGWGAVTKAETLTAHRDEKERAHQPTGRGMRMVVSDATTEARASVVSVTLLCCRAVPVGDLPVP